MVRVWHWIYDFSSKRERINQVELKMIRDNDDDTHVIRNKHTTPPHLLFRGGRVLLNHSRWEKRTNGKSMKIWWSGFVIYLP